MAKKENCDRFVAATFSKLVHFSMGRLGKWPEAAILSSKLLVCTNHVILDILGGHVKARRKAKEEWILIIEV